MVENEFRTLKRGEIGTGVISDLTFERYLVENQQI